MTRLLTLLMLCAAAPAAATGITFDLPRLTWPETPAEPVTQGCQSPATVSPACGAER